MLSDISLKTSRKVNKDFVIKQKIIPIKEDDKNVLIATPLDINSNKEIKFLFNKDISIKRISENEFLDLVKKIYIDNNENLTNIIIKEAIKSNASDIHIEPNSKEVIIRNRIDGILILSRKILFEEYNILVQTIKLSAQMDITERRKPQDGKLTFKDKNEKYDIRVSSVPLSYGEKLVLRILEKQGSVRSLDTINFTTKQKNKLNNMLKLNSGIILVAGPTGSGKSTTLYSMLSSIKSIKSNIVTLEDPIEIHIDGINQIALNTKLNLDFATGLRAILRQDPDTIMVGEIRDKETGEIAIRAAMTGHKVFSTIHTKSPGEVYTRLCEMGIEEYLVRDSICGIISQRLIGVLCKDCKKQISTTFINDKKIKLFKDIGCEKCNYTGYTGRKIVASIVFINSVVKEKLKNKNYYIEELTNKEMKTNLIELLMLEKITITDIQRFIKGEGINI